MDESVNKPDARSLGGVRTACAAILTIPTSLGLLIYTWFNPQQLIVLDGVLPLLWIAGAVVALLGTVMALVAIVLSGFKRRFPWLIGLIDLSIALFAIFYPLITATTNLFERGTPVFK